MDIPRSAGGVTHKRGALHTREHHSEDCRSRIYSQWEANNDPKWHKAQREIGIEETGVGDKAHVSDVDLEIEGLQEVQGAERSQNDGAGQRVQWADVEDDDMADNAQ